MSLGFFDIGRPLPVAGYRIDAEPDNLAVASRKLGLEAGHIAEFGGAHGRKVLRVREQDCPTVANPLVKVDGSLRGFSGEIWSFFAYS